MRLSRPPEIFVDGTPQTHYTVMFSDSGPENAGETILSIIGAALQREGVYLQFTAFEMLSADDKFDARVKFGIRLNGKDL